MKFDDEENESNRNQNKIQILDQQVVNDEESSSDQSWDELRKEYLQEFDPSPTKLNKQNLILFSMNEEQEPLRISRNANNVNRAKTNLNQIKSS